MQARPNQIGRYGSLGFAASPEWSTLWLAIDGLPGLMHASWKLLQLAILSLKLIFPGAPEAALCNPLLTPLAGFSCRRKGRSCGGASPGLQDFPHSLRACCNLHVQPE